MSHYLFFVRNNIGIDTSWNADTTCGVVFRMAGVAGQIK